MEVWTEALLGKIDTELLRKDKKEPFHKCSSYKEF